MIVAVFLSAWAFWWEPSSLQVEEYEIVTQKWYKKEPLRIAVLADLHTGSPHHGFKMLERIVQETNAASPDLILLAGDFVIHGVIGGTFIPPEKSAKYLSKLKARLGVYAVLGNHDWWFDYDQVFQAFIDNGIPVLEDRSILIQNNADTFWLAGISDFWEGEHDIDKALTDVPKGSSIIAFTHNPDLFPEIPDRVDLTIAGHTHGGQVNLPLLGRLVVPSRYDDRYAIGHIIENARHLFVTPGLGTSILPIRFRVPPEISIVTIRASN